MLGFVNQDGIYKGVDKSRAPTDYHMLLCSGYGTLNGEHYWDVQNSAGVKWGNKGFGKIIRQISRGGGRPSLIRSVIYPLVSEASKLSIKCVYVTAL